MKIEIDVSEGATAEEIAELVRQAIDGSGQAKLQTYEERVLEDLAAFTPVSEAGKEMVDRVRMLLLLQVRSVQPHWISWILSGRRD